MSMKSSARFFEFAFVGTTQMLPDGARVQLVPGEQEGAPVELDLLLEAAEPPAARDHDRVRAVDERDAHVLGLQARGVVEM